MGNGGANRSNPTALRSAGGRRVAGERTVAGVGRLRRPAAGGLQAQFDQARRNAAAAARRVARRG